MLILSVLAFTLVISSSSFLVPVGAATGSGNIPSMALSKTQCKDCWAGYGVFPPYPLVSTKIKVPVITCGATQSGVYFLAGLDGISDLSGDFAFSFVSAYCSGTSMTPYYWAGWFDGFTTSSVVQSSWNPSPGDSVTLAVTDMPDHGIFSFLVNDTTSKQVTSAISVDNYYGVYAADNEAECVSSTMVFNGVLISLANFGKVLFSGCNPIGSTNHHTKYISYNSAGTIILAKPTALSTTTPGNFHVVYEAGGP